MGRRAEKKRREEVEYNKWRQKLEQGRRWRKRRRKKRTKKKKKKRRHKRKTKK
ncbi:hypothetical protein E2C01_078825 [Portunus trituberculatus]|uniref:Uncharacterized protein n=1 Tax=Portunus trituberculatus TaxID=210409 RepID=A0A5B7IPS0_PORTR|nr:hypothetical protein [Portunus trituberculatus]